MNVYKGYLLTLEGIDGSGKSSVAHALYNELSKHYDVLLTKEPGATALGTHLRSLVQERTFSLDPKAEFLLFAADRVQHMTELVLPALKQGKIVISDRMADSSRAYQGFGRGLEDAWIKRINEWAMAPVEPDLTLYLKIDYATAHGRLQRRNERATVFEQEKAAFFKRVIDGFETIFKNRAHVLTIDASPSEAIVQQAAIDGVLRFLRRQL